MEIVRTLNEAIIFFNKRPEGICMCAGETASKVCASFDEVKEFYGVLRQDDEEAQPTQEPEWQ